LPSQVKYSSLNTLGDHALEIALSKGFSSGVDNVSEKLMLTVAELAEALEELRDGRDTNEIYFKGEKPEGFPVEMADAIIRILQLTAAFGIDMDAAVRMKMEYNMTRPPKHGRKF
jgi:hypothetical protein